MSHSNEALIYKINSIVLTLAIKAPYNMDKSSLRTVLLLSL